jgi:hypothetical protein
MLVPFGSRHTHSQSELKTLLDYNPDTGIFTWKINTKRTKIGDVSGYVDLNGYAIIRLNNKLYKAHRLAWLYVHNKIPDEYIDHINGIKSDNRICNLREANRYENQFNTKLNIRNISGAKGVSWNSQLKKWKVCLNINKQQKHFGYFENLELASLVATEAKIKFHKQFCSNY